jgi:hypothetical protein
MKPQSKPRPIKERTNELLDTTFRNPVPAVIKALVARLLPQAKPKVTTK